jgi:hypothetical protein
MKLSRTLCLLSLAGLFACGQPSLTQPDGGRARANCPNETTAIVVKVVDASDAPVEGATVTATNPTRGESITATTGGDGTTRGITEEIGPGTVNLRATLGARQSELRQVNWVCGECFCTAEPASVVLKLSN